MLISLVIKGSGSEEETQAAGGKAACDCPYQGQGARGGQGGQETKDRRSQFQDWPNMKMSTAWSSPGPSLSILTLRAQSNGRRAEVYPRLWAGTCRGSGLGFGPGSGRHTVQTSGLRPEDSDQEGEGTHHKRNDERN